MVPCVWYLITVQQTSVNQGLSSYITSRCTLLKVCKRELVLCKFRSCLYTISNRFDKSLRFKVCVQPFLMFLVLLFT
jgi:hypothetical protein